MELHCFLHTQNAREYFSAETELPSHSNCSTFKPGERSQWEKVQFADKQLFRNPIPHSRKKKWKEIWPRKRRILQHQTCKQDDKGTEWHHCLATSSFFLLDRQQTNLIKNVCVMGSHCWTPPAYRATCWTKCPHAWLFELNQEIATASKPGWELADLCMLIFLQPACRK